MGAACTHDDFKEKSVGDDDGKKLSYVGKAAQDCLEKHHGHLWHKLWNVTSGKFIQVNQTPHLQVSWLNNQDPPDAHDNWFPENMAKIMKKTKTWCDVTSLGPPDGLFMEAFKGALAEIAANADPKGDPVIVRMMFGNIVGMPVNCDSVIASLTEGLPTDANINLWVGAWRKGVSWNHSKIIAVDGYYLHNGGHNLWDPHYLKFDPVHDLSMECEGRVAHDGHLYANEQWHFVEKQQGTAIGRLVSKLPDNLPMILPARVTVSNWPEDIDEFPPQYSKSVVPKRPLVEGGVPMVSMGRYGDMESHARASDDAVVAMFNSAKTRICMALQDLGPITLIGVPGPIAVPGCKWPKDYMTAMGVAMWDRNVEVCIALSNPGSVPGGLKPTEALYGNGWTCSQVASEILKTIQETYADVQEADLRKCLANNLKVCYIRQMQGQSWQDGQTMGMHAKHFIIDNRAFYIGSQNLYIADLAEWGILTDDEATTKKCMDQYFNPLWKASYTGTDVNPDEVIAGLDVDRDGEDPKHMDAKTKKLAEQSKNAHNKVSNKDHHHDNDD